MHVSKSLEAEITRFMEIYWERYFAGDLQSYASFLRDDYHNIGTTESEDWRSKTEMMRYSESVIHQMTGKVQVRNRKVHIMPIDPYFMVHEYIDLYIQTGEGWMFYSKMRLSSLIEKTEAGWRVIHQHGSVPDTKAAEHESIGFEQVHKENTELRDAIKRRTVELEQINRELEIEAALERVRSRSIAMQDSADLSDVVFQMFTELVKLDAYLDRCLILIVNPETLEITWYLTGKEGLLSNNGFVVPYNEYPSHQAYLDGWRHKRKKWQYLLGGQEKKDWDAFGFTQTELSGLPDFVKSDMTAVDAIHLTISSDDFGCLIASSLSPLSEDHAAIVERFSVVFNQTYTRYLDLQKAEAQTREAQIEASLERIRAKAMAMHHSDELDEVLAVLCEQFDTLGIFPMSTHMTVLDIPNNKFTFRETGKFGNRSFGEQTVALDAMDTWKDMVESWKNADPYSINRLHFPKETLQQVWEVFHESFASMPDDSKIKPDDYPDGIYHTAGKHPFGYIGMNQVRPATEKEEQIVIKFANEFGRAYQRFLDLQKAEAQAREAQIEAALERVRAHAMGLRKSDDLKDIITVIFEELEKLGLTLYECSIFLRNENSREFNVWGKSDIEDGGFLSNYQFYFVDHPILNGVLRDLDLKISYREFSLVQEEIRSYADMIFSQTAFKDISQEYKDSFYSLKQLYAGQALFQHGLLEAVGTEPLPGDLPEVLRRFSQVVDLTYTRFLDLQKAESQAKESQIEAALEKVRSRSLAMHSSDELADASLVLDEQVRALGIETWGCAFHIYADDSEGDYEWFSSANGNLPFYKTPREKFFLDFYEKGQRGETFHIEEFAGEDCKAHYDFLKTLPVAGDALKALEKSGIPLPDYQIDHIAFFSHGYILFITYQPVPEAHEIFQRFARVFEQTYTRFIDLQKLEAQALRAENDLIAINTARHKAEAALIELKATQAQLVQQEKLASLGQLTAGIAHEIKNPLNFVNNFSEVSSELIDEVFDELEKLEDSDAKKEIITILNNVKGNLIKVHEHGTRANGIVSSMLQHSRGGSGKKEHTDLNALIKEYVNLSFHGMRAGKNPINAEINLQLDDQIRNVLLVSEDFSRVLLNLCNNAFDAMRTTADIRLPKLTIRTKLQPEKVIIEVEDNGPGIPYDIKDKILQPFFTTKKGTEGTGLGLSITNDIIKAHGGQLDIQSQSGSTIFKICLPI